MIDDSIDNSKGMVISDEDVTMDNQQPSPSYSLFMMMMMIRCDAVHRLRWQWVIPHLLRIA